MPSKRALSSSQSSIHATSLTPTSAARPAKRPRVQPSPSPSPPPSERSPAHQPSTAPSPAPTAALSRPAKRPVVKGTLRRLSSGHPSQSAPRTDSALAHRSKQRPRPRTRPVSTLAGAKVGGKSKDLADRVEAEELWVRRAQPAAGQPSAQGLGFAGYLKKGVNAFVERGCTTLYVNGMGAAIPLALSLALAIRDALPGGAPDAAAGTGDEPDAGEPVVQMRVRTGSKTVADEVTPDDEDADVVYQSRIKSTVSVELSLCEPLKRALGAGTGRVGRPGHGTSRRRVKRSGGTGRAQGPGQ